jgi:hypothetical protein
MALTTPPHKKFHVTKPHIREYGRGYVRQPRFFKNCRTMEEGGGGYGTDNNKNKISCEQYL